MLFYNRRARISSLVGSGLLIWSTKAFPRDISCKEIGYRALYGSDLFYFHRRLYTWIAISDYDKKCYSRTDPIAVGSRSC